MRYGVSYCIDLGSLEDERYIECKTIKQVDNEIKKLIDKKRSFLVYVKIHPKTHLYTFDIKFEIWQYCSHEDSCWKFNLRENIYLKRLKQATNRLRHTMIRYGR